MLCFAIATDTSAQDWSDREYGIGLIGFPIPSDQPPGSSANGITLAFYSSPSKESPQAAELRSDSLKLMNEGETVSLYARALEYEYEDVGFPILEFTPD
ncbi:MAG TPA: hypothetical protein VGB10_00030, partial [Bacteroidota bacterium]